MPLGFAPENLVTVPFTLNGQDYPEGDQVRLFYADLQERVRALPGVIDAGMIPKVQACLETLDRGVRKDIVQLLAEFFRGDQQFNTAVLENMADLFFLENRVDGYKYQTGV